MEKDYFVPFADYGEDKFEEKRSKFTGRLWHVETAEEAVAKFLVGEKQGDPTLLEIGREEDPDDPMACMHDCAKCSGCGPSELLKSIPVEEVK